MANTSFEHPHVLSEIAAAVKAEIARQCMIPDAAIGDDALLEDYDLDSMRRLALVVALEDRFGLEIADHELGTLRTVRDVVDRIARATQSKLTRSVTNARRSNQ